MVLKRRARGRGRKGEERFWFERWEGRGDV